MESPKYKVGGRKYNVESLMFEVEGRKGKTKNEDRRCHLETNWDVDLPLDPKTPKQLQGNKWAFRCDSHKRTASHMS